MTVFSWDEITAAPACPPLFLPGTAITVGSFDGPHRGHDVLFAGVRDVAAAQGYVPGAVTFTRSAAVKRLGERYPGDIATLPQRLSVLEECGLAFAIVIDFSEEFTKIRGEHFLSTLISRCCMKFIAEGQDFRCGWQGAVGAAEITAFAHAQGIACMFYAPVIDGAARVSSSRVRHCISRGHCAQAAALLGRPFALDCTAYPWEPDGTGVRVPRAVCSQVLPPDGRYAVKTGCENDTVCLCIDGAYLRLGVPSERIAGVRSLEFSGADKTDG
ncbi:MAG: FAD synthetase family protein [Treponema sp.]|nr:FAD synthetase family protein [Treponema sp.]